MGRGCKGRRPFARDDGGVRTRVYETPRGAGVAPCGGGGGVGGGGRGGRRRRRWSETTLRSTKVQGVDARIWPSGPLSALASVSPKGDFRGMWKAGATQSVAGQIACWLGMGLAAGCLPDIVVVPRDAGALDVMIQEQEVPRPSDRDSAEVDGSVPADISACPTGQSSCGGVCVVLATDPEHCGTCDRACPVVSHGDRTCAVGRCGFSCHADFQQVGSQCVPCGGTGQPVCVGGGCRTGLSDCGGVCRSLMDDVIHCGGCARACMLPNSASLCAEGRCVVASCGMGFGDCDNNPSNGCETNLMLTPASCGACGRMCSTAQVCTAGTCTSGQRSCAQTSVAGCDVVNVPGGTLTLGGDSMAQNAMAAQTDVTVRGFVMDRYPVTVARFRRFWNAGRPGIPGGRVAYRSGIDGSVLVPWSGPVTEPATTSDCNWGVTLGVRENHPINCVDWYTAQAFCVWDGGHLPTEAEWELAARTTDGRIWPWGNNADNTRICALLTTMRTSTCAVDGQAFMAGASPQTIMHLVGNVSEWAADNWSEYDGTGSGNACAGRSMLTNPVCTGSGGDNAARVLRGGAWSHAVTSGFRSVSRVFESPTASGAGIGFRCVRDQL